MNKTIIININSIVFHIEEDAYDKLRSYMIEIKKHFGQSEDSTEILSDIENRIAEMFHERIETGKKEVINNQDVEEVITQMGRVSDFELEDNENPSTPNTDYARTEQAYPYAKRLMRDLDDKVFSGVCSGIGHYFGLESKWVRIAFALLFILGGSGFLLYLILWIVMPAALTRTEKMEMRGEAPNIHNFKKSYDEEINTSRAQYGNDSNFQNSANSFGNSLLSILTVFVKAIGIIFLISIAFTLLATLIVLFVSAFGLLGFSNNEFVVMPNLLAEPMQSMALAVLCFVVIIPMIYIIYWTLQLLFNAKPMARIANFGLAIIWVVSLAFSAYFTIHTVRDFKDHSILSTDKPLQEFPTYRISENNIRVIRLNDSSMLQSKGAINFGQTNRFLDDAKKDIDIRFEKLELGQKPYIKYEYSARGVDYTTAAERSSKIKYNVVQQAENIIFDSHFMYSKGELYRKQEVNVTVYLPVGTKVILEKSIKNKLRNISYYGCLSNYPDSENLKETEWIMTETGLKCAIEDQVEDSDEDESIDLNIDSLSQAEINISKKDTLINISKKGVHIKTN